MANKHVNRGAGGTPGGVPTFVIGFIMTVTGAYLLLNQIHVTSSFWWHRFTLFGGVSVTPFGATLIPLLLGIGMIFFNGRSRIGWTLTILCILVVLIGIITNLQIYFAPTTFYVTLIIFILFAGGLGLVIRSLRAY